MNLFEVLLLSLVLILFPLLLYIIFLAANRNIDAKMKRFLFDILLISSLFISYQYSDKDYLLVTFLLSNSLILIAYLKNRVITANIIALLIFVLYYSSFNFLVFMLAPYLFLLALYYSKEKKDIKDFLFIDLFLFIQYIFLILWLFIFNRKLYMSLNFLNTLFIMIFNYLSIHIIYLLYDIGENIVKYNVDYKDLKHDQQIKVSLFKITHEIKNPIAVIKAYLDMLNIKDEKQVAQYIPIIKNETDRLLNLLQDFLLVNKVSTAFDLMDINLLIEEVTKQQKPLIKNRKIKLECHLIDDEVYINGDYQRLSQVLINILKNSIEAIALKDKGIIKIRNSINNKELHIIIEDNGSGISKKNLKKIKEPFYTTKNRGTGLGVSLSDEIIKAHNGVLLYESVEGKGTKVTIKLPLYGKEKLC